MSSKIPIDILPIILENLDKPDIATVCRLNKVCCACSQPILFRDIHIRECNKGLAVCWTLSRSPHLASCVRSFSIRFRETGVHLQEYLADTLQNLSSLRHLTLSINYGFSPLPGGRTFNFKLDSFSFQLSYDQNLRSFLDSQPSLTTIDFWPNERDGPQIDATCLPNLTRVAARLCDLNYLIPGRPVSDVTCYTTSSTVFDLNLFTRSTAPIQKLTINYSFLYPTPGSLLASVFPSLTHLTITSKYTFVRMMTVRGPLFFYLFSKLNKHIVAKLQLL
jgi:hypothetical protein